MCSWVYTVLTQAFEEQLQARSILGFYTELSQFRTAYFFLIKSEKNINVDLLTLMGNYLGAG